MGRLPSSLLLVLLPALAAVCEGKLAIVLLDGFKWDYVDQLDEAQIPTLKGLIAGGLRTEYTQPIFPSVSFPCWTTIVTGGWDSKV